MVRSSARKDICRAAASDEHLPHAAGTGPHRRLMAPLPWSGCCWKQPGIRRRLSRLLEEAEYSGGVEVEHLRAGELPVPDPV